MRAMLGWLGAIGALVMLTGCSAYMAANQPGQKDFSVFKVGTSRARVIAEIGSPSHSETTPSGKSDIFTFVQGYHGAVKAGRAVVHGVASVATLGLWEVIGTPVEGHLNGSQLSVRVLEDRVMRVEPLKGDEEVLRNLNDVQASGAVAPVAAVTPSGPMATSGLATGSTSPTGASPYGAGTVYSAPPTYPQTVPTGVAASSTAQ